MIRSAAKNFAHVAVVASPDAYTEVMEELQRTGGSLSLQTRAAFAQQALARTADYDASIAAYLASNAPQQFTTHPSSQISNLKSLNLTLHKSADLRYGENPHQQAALYTTASEHSGIARAEVLHGKEMSYNNYVDADAAWQLVCDLDAPACAIIKHTNPAGAAVAETLAELIVARRHRPRLSLRRPSSVSIVPLTRKRRALLRKFSPKSSSRLNMTKTRSSSYAQRKTCACSARARRDRQPKTQLKQISGGILLQTPDTYRLTRDQLRVVTRRQPTESEIADLLFAWTICKHTKSTPSLCTRPCDHRRRRRSMSRVDSVRLGAERARNNNVEVAKLRPRLRRLLPFRDGIRRSRAPSNHCHHPARRLRP
jgi:phosphoribosylaminoimidazolecarboxamide formyltransferase/IMP cyclohydrolase